MKKFNLILIALIALFFGACKTDITKFTGTPGAAGTSSSDSYQPVTKNSYWKYRSSLLGIVDTTIDTMTGGTALINGKTYYTVSGTSHAAGAGIAYYHIDNHQFTARASTAGVTIDLYYLNDTMAVNHSWTSSLSDNGYVNGVPGRVVGKVLEKGISKTVAGRVFTNVIHTYLDLQYDYGTGFTSIETYDYYIAKGVGVVKVDTNLGGITGTTDIFDYSIK